MTGPIEQPRHPIDAGRRHESGSAAGSAPASATDARRWTWRGLWRNGGLGAVLVVFASLWLLVALWMISSGAPSSGGTPPEIVIIDPAQG